MLDKKHSSTSWEPIEKWYSGSVGDEGHYYHQHVVLPGALKLLDLKSDSSLLDLACGSGVLARRIPSTISYTGIDLSPSLIKTAKKSDPSQNHQYITGDATKPLKLTKKDFSHASIILAIQNMESPKEAFANAAKHLSKNGSLVVVMNHPCFRIPRQSSWKVDEEQRIQYRRIDRYSSSLKVPIHAHPGKGDQSPVTWSFHHSLADYSRWFFEAGFTIELIEEWHSNKVSSGKAAKMENRARLEIPLFLAFRVKKL